MRHADPTQFAPVDSLLAYFVEGYTQHLSRYRAATYVYQRRNARKWVLHYGRLIRKMRAA